MVYMYITMFNSQIYKKITNSKSILHAKTISKPIPSSIPYAKQAIPQTISNTSKHE